MGGPLLLLPRWEALPPAPLSSVNLVTVGGRPGVAGTARQEGGTLHGDPQGGGGGTGT